MFTDICYKYIENFIFIFQIFELSGHKQPWYSLNYLGIEGFIIRKVYESL